MCVTAQALNAYTAEASQAGRCVPVSLLFHVQQGSVQAELPARGSIGPLLLASGLITQAELEAGAGLLSKGACKLQAQQLALMDGPWWGDLVAE